MDWFAVASLGTYPTPGVTATQRAAFAVSYGLLSLIPPYSAPVSHAGKIFLDMFMTL